MNYTKNNEGRILLTLKDSYYEYLKSGSRSNKKLKILHGTIANDLKTLLPKEYKIISLNLLDGKEAKIQGKYYTKVVDIAIKLKEKIVGIVGVKFVMQNYAQNANNYFENLLGETVNIQLCNIPYFNMLFLQEETPYFQKSGALRKFEKITENRLQKYLALYEKNTSKHFHVPKLFFLGILKKDNINFSKIKQQNEYKKHLLNEKKQLDFKWTKRKSKNLKIIINNYQLFLESLVQKINNN